MLKKCAKILKMSLKRWYCFKHASQESHLAPFGAHFVHFCTNRFKHGIQISHWWELRAGQYARKSHSCSNCFKHASHKSHLAPFGAHFVHCVHLCANRFKHATQSSRWWELGANLKSRENVACWKSWKKVLKKFKKLKKS